MNGSADHECPPTTPANNMGRLRALQVALKAAKVTPVNREIVTYLAAHCDHDGSTYVTLKRIAADLGYKHRSSVWVAIEAARVAGFVERVTGDDRDLWIIPMMRAPRRAHLSEQVRAESEDLRASGRAQAARVQTRAPSEETVSNTRRDEPLRFERSPETVAEVARVRAQLQSKRVR